MIYKKYVTRFEVTVSRKKEDIRITMEAPSEFSKAEIDFCVNPSAGSEVVVKLLRELALQGYSTRELNFHVSELT